MPLDPEHPARRWAARRHLWRPGDPWPDAVRWLEDGGGSLVAAFAPVPDWREAHPPDPSGVQLVHVAADGSPRTDAGGLSKRSHGSLTAAVCLIGGPLEAGQLVHVAEGVADGLAVAGREHGTALAVSGTAAFSRLAPSLAALDAPVAIHADGDSPGIAAARKLFAGLAGLGTVAGIIQYAPGCDPAEPGEDWE